ncbi:hypothetical protein BDZ97DRAFT_1833447 [Flammula alnicola]|nr:hypothetical protein BDZ97DRAFT_1833447 [Flammula alnicola]
MLDSSPVALPPVRRPLKRSASTASLPTPPRTHRKHARGRSRGSCDSESDENAVLSSDDEELGGHKKRRTGDAIEAANEEAFWLSGSAGLNADAAAESLSKDDSASKSKAVPLLYRRRHAQQAHVDVAPVSPPPSHRKAAVGTLPLDSVPGSSSSPPSTPRATRSATKRAIRDSPDNPFLATPVKVVEDSDTPSASSANPSPHTPNHEKPTVTYVFRGVRRVYQNPLYNHAEDRPYSPPPASKLPIEDPDYSPAVTCTPKLLFPAARRNTKGKKAAAAAIRTKSKKRARSPSLSGDEAQAAEIRPLKLNFGEPEKKKNVQTLDQELKTAGEPLSI